MLNKEFLGNNKQEYQKIFMLKINLVYILSFI